MATHAAVLNITRTQTPIGIVLPILEEDAIADAMELESIALSGFAEPEPAPAPRERHCVLLMPPGAQRTAATTELWDSGLVVTAFGSPHEADHILRSEPVDAIILDAALGLQLVPQMMAWLHATGLSRIPLVVVGVVDPALQHWLASIGVSRAAPSIADVSSRLR